MARFPGQPALCALAIACTFAARVVPARAHAIVEYALPDAESQPAGIVAGPDGNLWFTEGYGNQIGKVTTSGAITEYPVPTAESLPSGITAGPDGNLWFTEYSGNQIGKVTTSGAITEYVIPTSNSGPLGITVGPDGNLWFTESHTAKIATVTPTGTFTEYAIPGGDLSPGSIVAGPDGNLWFTELGHNFNLIGKVTTSGTFTEYVVPTPSDISSSGPTGITAGPDGNLWFVDPRNEYGFNAGEPASVTGVVTTSGAFTEYVVPTTFSGGTSAITVGPDGNLWFTEFYGNQIGKVTTSGVFTEYALATPDSRPYGITTGPDGNLWFTEYGDGAIGSLASDGLGPLCAAAPEVGCRTAQNGSLSLRRGLSTDKDELKWKWLKGAATAKVPDFGTPTTTTDYQLCVYDGNSALIADAYVPAGATCGGSPCWSDTAHGFKYRDNDLTPEGIRSVLLREGIAGQARIVVKGKGRNLTMPSMLPLTQPVKAQLVESDGVCWEGTFSAPAVDNSTRLFLDKVD